MKLDFFHDQTLDAMGAYMSRLTQRQQIVASNLANIDTPGFKTKDISFHATMQELISDPTELRTTSPKHNDGWNPIASQPQVFEVEGLTSGDDQNQNNVDLDREMMKGSETLFGYSLISQLLRGKFRTIASSINEGKA
jgi:flagellar basal-body rod protein FlgB